MGFKKKTNDLVALRKEELVAAYLAADSEEDKRIILAEWSALDDRSLEWEGIQAEHRIDGKTLFNGGLTVLIAGATLVFECSETLRSKVTNLWLRRVR